MKKKVTKKVEESKRPPETKAIVIDYKTEVLKGLDFVNRELNAIKKDQKAGSGSYSYSYRGIYQVLNALSPLLRTAKIVTRRKVIHSERDIVVNNKGNKEHRVFYHCEYIFTSLIDGSELVTEGFGEAIDPGDKATGKAISNAYKYVIFELFNIPTEEQKDSDDTLKNDIKQENILSTEKVELISDIVNRVGSLVDSAYINEMKIKSLSKSSLATLMKLFKTSDETIIKNFSIEIVEDIDNEVLDSKEGDGDE